jgi:hypothetical protein
VSQVLGFDGDCGRSRLGCSRAAAVSLVEPTVRSDCVAPWFAACRWASSRSHRYHWIGRGSASHRRAAS